MATLESIEELLLDIQYKVDELWKLQGMDIDFPMTVTPTLRETNGIQLAITGNGTTTTTVTRFIPRYDLVDHEGNNVVDHEGNLIEG